MSSVRTAALSRLTAPTFGLLHDLEIVKLRCLPAWQRWLYFELVLMSNFKTGFVSVHRAVLLSLLDCDQPERGPRLQTVSVDMLRDGLDALGATGLADWEAKRNKRKGALEISVLPREGFSAPAEKHPRKLPRPSTPREASKHAGSEASYPQNRPGNKPRGSRAPNLSTVGASLSPDDGPAPIAKTLDDVRDEIEQRIATRRGRSRAPKGA